MRIGIDARLLERKITGIGRFLINLLENFPKYDKENEYYLFTYAPINFKSDFYKNSSTVRTILPQKIFSPIWGNLILPFYLKKHKIDILFSVNQVVPLIKVKNCKYIAVVHDVIYKADPNFLPFIYRNYLKLYAHFSIKLSDLIITVSEFSKFDILRHYKIDPNKVKVVLQFPNPLFQPCNIGDKEKSTLKKQYNLGEKIVLYVGMIENRKNLQTILKVADRIKELKQNVSFVLVGKIGHGGMRIIDEINKRNNVIHLKNIDDEKLKLLYNISDVFLFPSLYEGFGYPPLEAMQSGLPVIASNNTSLKELLGNGAILCEPQDINAIVKELIRLFEDKVYWEEVRKHGIENSKKFSIEKSVKEIIKIFNTFKE
jgi:hypothetical protein